MPFWRMADGKVSDVVVVVGSTGVGKSKLAVDLARHLGGEVVNADALQVYRGLDVTTNKVTDEEAKGDGLPLLPMQRQCRWGEGGSETPGRSSALSSGWFDLRC